MITTGICFSLDDSCKIFCLKIKLDIYNACRSSFGQKRRENIATVRPELERKTLSTHLDLLQELVSRHLRHPVVRDYHAHVVLLDGESPNIKVDQKCSHTEKDYSECCYRSQAYRS
jgi:2'-5' RNA ligase